MIKIFYFSGTGNTKIVAENFKNEFENNDEKIELINIENTNTETILEKDDLIGIMYPIFGGGTPKNVTAFIKQLEFKNNKVFLIKTAADFTELNHNTSRDLIKQIKLKGGDPFYDRIITMGSNWLIEYSDDFVKQLYNISKRKSKHTVNEILNGTIRHFKKRPFIDLFAKLMHYLESNLGSPLFALTLYPNKNCNSCNICVKNCPVNNIRNINNGKIKFSTKCLFCMRCIYNCPKKAIKSRFFNFVILKRGYNIKNIIKNESLKGEFIDSKTKGFYKHFISYINNDEI